MPHTILNSDGSCTVSGLVARAFVPMNHLQVSATAANAVAKICLLFAREHNWLAVPDVEDSAKLIPLKLEELGFGPDGGTTFFVASSETSLVGPISFSALPTTVLLMGRCYVIHLGSSSVGFMVDVYTYPESCETDKVLVARFKMIRVNVNKKSRNATLMSAEIAKALSTSLAASHAAATPEERDSRAIQRLIVKDILDLATKHLSCCVDGNIPPSPLAHSTDVKDLLSSYRRLHHLRESDIDYNLHFNQERMQQLVSDAFRGATGDARCLLSRVVPEGQSYIMADLLIRQFQIDYVKEVPMNIKAVEVQVFLASQEDEQMLRTHSGRHAFANVVKVLFICRAMYNEDPDAYPAIVGRLSVAV